MVSSETKTAENKTAEPKPGPLKHIITAALRDVTPVRLKLFLFVDCVLPLAVAVLAICTVNQHKHALQTVGSDAAPSVVAAQAIKRGIAQMDGSLADELMSNDPARIEQTVLEFEDGRATVCNNLVAAAKNITYGKAEQTPIEKLQLALGSFEMQAQRARDIHALNSLEEVMTQYYVADEIVQNSLLPNADALSKANVDMLESTYADEKSSSALLCGAVLGLGLVLLCALVFTQVYLAARFRRRLNLHLLIASLFTILFFNHIYTSVRESAERLRFAKEDSYDSIYAIAAAHSNVYAARAAQSRFLLDPKHADMHQESFDKNLAQVANFAPGTSFITAIAEAKEKLTPETQRLSLTGLSGNLAEEFQNIEYPGEGQAAFDILVDLQNFVNLDNKMRDLEHRGEHESAVQMCLSYNPNGIMNAFSRLDEDLDRALKINRDHFHLQVEEARRDLEGLMILSEVFALVVILLVYSGLRPRLAEYLK